MSSLLSQFLPNNNINSNEIVPDTTFVLVIYFVMVAVVILTCIIIVSAVSVNLIKKYNKLKNN